MRITTFKYGDLVTLQYERGLKDYILLEKSFARLLGMFNKGLILSIYFRKFKDRDL